MTRETVSAWVSTYERAWRDGDLDAVQALFTEHASYRESPYEPPHVGHDAIRDFWLVDEGKAFTVDATVVAVEDHTAVLRLEVHYLQPARQEYRDLWVLRFADDGRVADFEEWADWPGRPFASSEPPRSSSLACPVGDEFSTPRTSTDRGRKEPR